MSTGGKVAEKHRPDQHEPLPRRLLTVHFGRRTGSHAAPPKHPFDDSASRTHKDDTNDTVGRLDGPGSSINAKNTMIERVEKLPDPQPDVDRLLAALRRDQPDRVPLIELAVDPEVVTALRGGQPLRWDDAFDATQAKAFAREHNAFWRRLGYDYVRVSPPVVFDLKWAAANDQAELSRGQRAWADSARGTLHSLDDVERYPWPKLRAEHLRRADAILEELPEGMGAIGFSGGVFEFASQLVGLQRFLIAIYDDPDFVRAVVDGVAEFIRETFKAFCARDRIKALWLGDDLGSKNATLVDPVFLRETIFPWYREYAELAHATGRLFLLHSCGNLAAVMDDFIAAGVDAKHSFEDAIMPVEEIKRRWGDWLAVLGGVDVDLLARGSEPEICDRTRVILEACAVDGGYACGSGNSIANYVPPDNYLAMLETVHRFNGRM
jgi:uroporphyrinogen decarboxylase